MLRWVLREDWGGGKGWSRGLRIHPSHARVVEEAAVGHRAGHVVLEHGASLSAA